MQRHRSLATEDEVKWLGKIFHLLLQLVASNEVFAPQIATKCYFFLLLSLFVFPRKWKSVVGYFACVIAEAVKKSLLIIALIKHSCQRDSLNSGWVFESVKTLAMDWEYKRVWLTAGSHGIDWISCSVCVSASLCFSWALFVWFRLAILFGYYIAWSPSYCLVWTRLTIQPS